MAGMPRRVFEYARNLQTLNDWVSISAFLLGGSILIFLINFVMSMLFWREREVGNPWRSRSLEWQLSSPPPPEELQAGAGDPVQSRTTTASRARSRWPT